MSSQYGKLRPISGCDRFTSLGHPSKFQRVSRVGFVTVPMSLKDVNQTLHDVWPSPWLVRYVCVSGGACLLTEFCKMQNSLCVQVLRSPILAALMHVTGAAGASTKLCGVVQGNGITELLQKVPPILDRAAITLGIGPHSSFFNVSFIMSRIYAST